MDPLETEHQQLEAARLRAKELACEQFGYADFIDDFAVKDPAYWFGMEVRTDGVYVAIPANDAPITPRERSDSTWHHEKDLSKPALKFPYNLQELHDFISAYNLAGVIANNELYALLTVLSEDADSVRDVEVKALRRQEDVILQTLKELQYDPKALPPNIPGKRGVKSECRQVLAALPLFDGSTVFKKAWERLQAFELIAYAKAENPPPPKF